MTPEGEPMPGGNTAPVVRLGDTVRRAAGPWTPRVAALLTGLRAAGVPGVPEHRGLDEQGREVVEFLAGDVPVYPVPAWLWSDDVLRDVGAHLRRLHDASAGLDVPRTGWRRAAVEPVEVVCHGDVAPYNSVFHGGRLSGFIDWDHARPAPRLYDLGSAAYRFVPLAAPTNVDAPGPEPAEQWRRAGVLAAAYGGVLATDVVRAAADHLADLVATSPLHVDVYVGDLAHVRALLS